MDQPEFPNKLYFRIGEVAKIVGVKPYVLRYWETEFPLLKPGKTPSRHRLYRRRDVELLLEIKRLLYGEGFTIAGAKKQLKDSDAAPPQTPQDRTLPSVSPETGQRVLPPEAIALESQANQRKILREIRADLQALCEMLVRKSA